VTTRRQFRSNLGCWSHGFVCASRYPAHREPRLETIYIEIADQVSYTNRVRAVTSMIENKLARVERGPENVFQRLLLVLLVIDNFF
jgi:hypothetical protein